MLELKDKYKLIHCYRTSEQVDFLNKINHLLSKENLRKEYKKRQSKLLSDSIDVSSFLVWFYENYPKSRKSYFSSNLIQKKFV